MRKWFGGRPDEDYREGRRRKSTHAAAYYRVVGALTLLPIAVFLPPDSARAAILGYHDVSSPVNTTGWACATDSEAPVRVHLYAQTAAGPQFIDVQWADKRRGDLPGVCAGVNHAFRFADYATNAAGIALFGSAVLVPMLVYVEAPGGLVPLNGSPRSVSFAAVGLWDPGLKTPRWRTDYDNQQEGTAAAPLLLGECPFRTPISEGLDVISGGGTDPMTHCRYTSTVMPRSNAATSELTWPMHDFWAVVANVEDAILNPLCVNGPPGQSLPIGRPGTGQVFGVDALPDFEGGDPGRMKMHLVLNSLFATRCREGSYGGPYLSFGAQTDRGNEGVLTYLNHPGAATTLSFGLTLMDIAGALSAFDGVPAGARRYSQGHVLIEVIWGGQRRWLFIELIPDVRNVFGTAEGSVDARIRFNWHMVNSMMYPGSDYVFKSANILSKQCAEDGVALPVVDRAVTYVNPLTRDRARREYRIDLQRVFDCLKRIGAWGSDPMPVHPVPVTGVMFGIEQDDRLYLNGGFTGIAVPNALWVAIDSVRLE